MNYLSYLFWLLGAHALTDYVLQSPEMAARKHPPKELMPSPGTGEQSVYGPWWWWMTAHALINGLGVAYVTQSALLGLGEMGLHWGLDYSKCRGWITVNQDQAGHLLSKVAWAWLA